METCSRDHSYDQDQATIPVENGFLQYNLKTKNMQLSAHFEGNTKPLATKKIFSDGEGTAILIRLLENGELPKHMTKIPAKLICLEGTATYQELDGRTIALEPHMTVEIPVNHEHAVTANADGALLILLK